MLLYRKHVVTKQPYIPATHRPIWKPRIYCLPVPIFINGVEGHVAVTGLDDDSPRASRSATRGITETLSLSKEAVDP